MAKGMKGLMKQAQKMQREMMKAQEEMAGMEFEGKAGGGMVTVKLNGQGALTGISLQPDAVDPDDVEMLEDLILAAYNNAKQQCDETSQGRMSGLTGGLNLPGMG